MNLPTITLLSFLLAIVSTTVDAWGRGDHGRRLWEREVPDTEDDNRRRKLDSPNNDNNVMNLRKLSYTHKSSKSSKSGKGKGMCLIL